LEKAEGTNFKFCKQTDHKWYVQKLQNSVIGVVYLETSKGHSTEKAQRFNNIFKWKSDLLITDEWGGSTWRGIFHKL